MALLTRQRDPKLRPGHLDQDDVLEMTGFTPEQFEAAKVHLGFPKGSLSVRDSIWKPGPTAIRIWLEKDVTRWVEAFRTAARKAPRKLR